MTAGLTDRSHTITLGHINSKTLAGFTENILNIIRLVTLFIL
jgi:hypothetical protein